MRHPYDQGYLDYEDGFHLSECPYSPLFAYGFYLDWKEGWLDAEEDDDYVYREAVAGSRGAFPVTLMERPW